MIKAIMVAVESRYLPEYSNMLQDEYVFAYHITIENRGDQTVTLKKRYWRITDALGRVEEVNGEGVVGETPTLAPNDEFDYTSSARLHTPWGEMVGHYEFETITGERFKVDIPQFILMSDVTLQ